MLTAGANDKVNPAMFWAMAYKVSDVLMLLAESSALVRLAEHELSHQELGAAMGWQEAPLKCMLDLLVRAGVLACDGTRFSVPVGTTSVLPLVAMEAQTRRWHASSGSLRRMLETGQTIDPLNAIQDEGFHAGYQQAMAASARALALHVFRHAGLPPQARVLDIGGADGAVSEQLARLMPGSTFCVVDRPPVQAHFDARIAGTAQPDRFRFVSDDVTHPGRLLLEAGQSNVVILSNLLHMIAPTPGRELLAKLRAALPPASRLIIYDQFLARDRFDVASLMTVDWVNLGTLFSLSEDDMAELLAELGYVSVTRRRFPLLPGALVCAETE